MRLKFYGFLFLTCILLGSVGLSQAQAPENCTNGIDDNGNGWIDCQDSTCFGIDNCDDCVSDTDNDGDGLIGCNDPDCTAMALQCDPSGSEVNCNNGIDDDGDGPTDCMDRDCWGIGECENCAEFEGDSDGNGQIACFDPDCIQFIACDPGFESECSNSLDDDQDSLVDCDDPDCSNKPACNADVSGGGCSLNPGHRTNRHP